MPTWDEFKDIFKSRKWRELFLYQFVLPLVLFLLLSFFLGLDYPDSAKNLLFGGEITLISTFLIIGAGVEMRASPLNPDSDKAGFSSYIHELWLIVVLITLISYVFNKNAAISCAISPEAASCITKYGAFTIINTILVLLTPIYYFVAIITFNRQTSTTN